MSWGWELFAFFTGGLALGGREGFERIGRIRLLLLLCSNVLESVRLDGAGAMLAVGRGGWYVYGLPMIDRPTGKASIRPFPHYYCPTRPAATVQNR